MAKKFPFLRLVFRLHRGQGLTTQQCLSRRRNPQRGSENYIFPVSPYFHEWYASQFSDRKINSTIMFKKTIPHFEYPQCHTT